MPTPANLTQLKKHLVPGMLLRRSHTKHCPVPEVVPVVRVQGNAFTIRMTDGKESWHTYTSAKCYTFDPLGFTVNLAEYGTARYEYVAP